MDTNSVPKVLYIAGYSRSGSTLLDILLGSAPGVASTGEVSLVAGDWAADRMCTCGSVLSKYPVWHELFMSAGEARQVQALMNGVEKARSMSSLLAGKVDSARAEAYRFWVRRIFSHVAERMGSGWIVDSSKSSRGVAGRLLALSRIANLEVKVIHLIRSGRGTAATYAAHGSNWVSEGRIRPYPLVVPRAIVGWTLAHRRVERLLRSIPADGQMRVHYEDLVERPAETLKRVGEFSGINVAPVLDRIRANDEFAVGHLIGGNRMAKDRHVKVRVAPARDEHSLRLTDELVYRLVASRRDRSFGY